MDYKILVADDDPDILRITEHLLKKEGYTVRTAANGRECLHAIHENKPDLLLLDVILPDISGVDICQTIKRDPGFSQVYILLHSGMNTKSEEISEGLEHGADGYLVKPVSNRELLARVEAACRIIRAERTLSELKARTDTILASVPDIIMEVGAGKVYTWTNQSGYDFFGDDVIGKEASFYFEGEQPANETVLPMFNGGGDTFYVESWQRRRDGEKRLLAWWSRWLKDDAGKVTATLATARDITLAKQSAVDVSVNKEKFRRLFEHSPTGKSLTSLDGKIIVNQAFCDITGYPKEELLQIKWHEITHPDDVAHDQQVLQRIIRGELNSHRWEKRYIKKNGHTVWVDVSTVLERDHQGNPDYFITSIIDITALKHMEITLRKSEENLAITLDSIGDGVISTGPDGIIVRMNAVAERLCGWPGSEAIGKPLQEVFRIINAHTREPVEDPATMVLKEGKVIGLANHTILISRDGVERQISDSAAPIKNKDGAIQGVVLVFSDVTEQYEAQKAIRDNERLLRESQEVTRLGSYIWDISTGFWTSSKILDDIFGIDEKYIRSLEGWLRLIHPAWQEKMTGYITNEVVGKHQRFDLEYKIINQKDVEERWVHGLGELELDSNQQPKKLIGTITDITVRKQAENALRSSEARLSAFLEFIPALILIKDHMMRPVFANRKFYSYFPGEEWLGKTPGELFPPEIADQMIEKDNEALTKGYTSYEETWKDKKDYLHTFLTEKFRIDIPDGHPLIGSIITDITEKKLVAADLEMQEKILRIAEIRARVLIENAPDGIVMINNESRCIYASPPAMRMFGYTFEEYTKLDPDTLTHPDDLPMVLETLGRLIQDPSLVPTIHYRYRHKDGHWLWIESTFSNLFNIPGVDAIVINFHDVTDRKRAEDDLFKAKEKAEESDRLKSTFLANMSHEIRTPMNAIVGFAGMLSDPEFSIEDHNRFSEIIQSRSDDLMRIINDLLEISRIETGNATIVKDSVSVNVVLNEMETVFLQRLPKINKGNLTLVADKISPDFPPAIITDGYILKQVFSNLLDNAIKYTVTGTIRFGCHPPENGAIKGYVADTGIGISQKNQKIIFEHFRQAESQDPYKYGGTGLGLSICKGALELLGGNIWVDSAPGEGSTFYFTIPFEYPACDIPHPVSAIRHPVSAIYNWSGKKILLVEDEPTNMEYLQLIFDRTNVQLITAANGSQLRALYDALDSVDLILLDVRLPDASGWDLARELKTLHPLLPVIAQTAYAMPADRQKSLDAGCDDYISKPIKKEQLLGKLAAYLGK